MSLLSPNTRLNRRDTKLSQFWHRRRERISSVNTGSGMIRSCKRHPIVILFLRLVFTHWTVDGLSEATKRLYAAMNTHQENACGHKPPTSGTRRLEGGDPRYHL